MGTRPVLLRLCLLHVDTQPVELLGHIGLLRENGDLLFQAARVYIGGKLAQALVEAMLHVLRANFDDLFYVVHHDE